MLKYWYIGIIGVVLLANCKKDPPIPGSYPCEEIEYNPNGPALNYLQPDTVRSTPTYNPLVQDEIFYLFAIRSSGLSEIHKRNLVSGVESVVCSGVSWSEISASTSGWLAFNLSGNDIWKVKSNGDSLTQLTFDQSSYDPFWNGNGDKYGFRQVIGSTYRTIICNPQGQHLDTISGYGWQHTAWSRNNQFLISSPFTADLEMYIFSSGSTSTIPGHGEGDPTNEHIRDIVISPDSRFVYWCNGWGIFSHDLSTGSSKKIISSCDTRDFFSLDVSPDGLELIANCYETRMLNYETNSLHIESKIYTMKVNGTYVTEVDF